MTNEQAPSKERDIQTLARACFDISNGHTRVLTQNEFGAIGRALMMLRGKTFVTESAPEPGLHHWWCETCQRQVENVEVTYDETHDLRSGGCGQHVFARPSQPPSTEPPAARGKWDVMKICGAYESGFGHGAKGDGLPNPYNAGSAEFEAYQIGVDTGRAEGDRAAQPPGLLRPGLERAIEIVEAIETPSDYYDSYKNRLVNAIGEEIWPTETKQQERPPARCHCGAHEWPDDAVQIEDSHHRLHTLRGCQPVPTKCPECHGTCLVRHPGGRSESYPCPSCTPAPPASSSLGERGE